MSDINTLRTHLFETLSALRDPARPMEIDRAKAVVDVAQAVINTAKVEVEYLRVTGAGRSSFIPIADAAADDTAIERLPGDGKGIKGVLRHRIK